jgi:signal transduction histidine kinase
MQPLVERLIGSDWLRSLPKPAVTACGLGLALGVGVVDYLTGFEVSVILLYLMPVGLASWFAGRAQGVFIACISTGIWLAAELLARAQVGYTLVSFWNAFTLIVSLLVGVFLTTALKEAHEHLEATVAQRTAALRKEVAERRHAEEEVRKANTDLSASHEQLVSALSALRATHVELQHTQLQLIEAAKMESVGRLAAGVAHEVKNPLMTLSMGADYFQQLGPRNADEAALLNDMKEAVERAGRIINDLLDYARPRPLQLASEDLNAVIEDALKLVRSLCVTRRIQVVRELRPELPLVPVDRNKITQVFVNLFTNAIDAMREGGTLTVRTSAPVAANPPGEAGAVTVQVEDTGLGIRPEQLDKVFDPFFTTKPPGKGTGLGLAIVRKVIEFHEGSIHLANRPEGGARATIRFKTQPKDSHAQTTHPGH